MNDLLSHPLWQPETLGKPLPDSPHAVSVSLPLWEHVVGYEEGAAEVVDQMQAGYPRFFLALLTKQLFQVAEERFAMEGEGAMVFPSRDAAERCRAYALKREPEVGVRLEAMGKFGLWAVVFPEAVRATIKLYWRFSGEIVSSRCAEAFLENRTPDTEAGAVAKRTLRQRLARHAGVGERDVFLVPSGMAAVSMVHRMLEAALPHRESVQLDFPYVDALKVQEEFGHGAHFFPRAKPEDLAAIHAMAAVGFINGVYVEAPSNPLLRCVPLAKLADHLQKCRVPLVIDDTVATVLQVNALKFADVVTTSLTKSFSGVGDVLAGAITLNPRSLHYTSFREFLEAELERQDLFWSEDAVVLDANSRDFPKRVRRASQNAELLAKALRRHPAVDQVFYPREDDLGWRDIKRPGAGSGCLLSFTLKRPSDAPSVYDALRVCKGPSLGTNFTLVCPYTLLAHYQELDWAAECGVAASLLRVSVGLEEPDDLLERFATALQIVSPPE